MLSTPIAGQQGAERFLALPFRMLVCEFFDSITYEEKLKRIRFFAYEGAVIIDHGNALVRRDVTGIAAVCYICQKVEDRRFAGAAVPGRQRISCLRSFICQIRLDLAFYLA